MRRHNYRYTWRYGWRWIVTSRTAFNALKSFYWAIVRGWDGETCWFCEQPSKKSFASLTNQRQEPEPTLLEIWVDDCKPAPPGCAVARTYDDALRMLRTFEYSKLYLDHDLGDSIYDKTGYDLLMVLIEEGRVPPVVQCISWNPVGRKRIAAALASRTSESVPREELLK